jgi:hypothetical protein
MHLAAAASQALQPCVQSLALLVQEKCCVLGHSRLGHPQGWVRWQQDYCLLVVAQLQSH